MPFQAPQQKQLTVNLGKFTGETARMRLASFAEKGVRELIASGQGSPAFTRYVNGREGVSEYEVQLPGPILYQFSWVEQVATFALAFLKARWPVRGPGRGGHFLDSYFVLGGGRAVPPKEAWKYDEIYITNDKPYARKAQTGFKGFLASRGMYEDCRQAVFKEFGRGLLQVDVRFIQLSGGYVLKGGRKRILKNGRSVGAEMRYPALYVRIRK